MLAPKLLNSSALGMNGTARLMSIGNAVPSSDSYGCEHRYILMEVIPEVLESSLLIAAETLVQTGIPMKKAILHVRAARAERYASLRDFYEPPKK